MFVDVENINNSAIECDVLIKKARNKKGELTPDLALSSLRLTNHIANMKLIVANIYAIKDKNKRLAFKDVVIAMVERRVQSESVMEKLRALAIEGGYEKEFDEANAKTKWLGKQVCARGEAVGYRQFLEGKEKLSPPIIYKEQPDMSYLYNVDYLSVCASRLKYLKCTFTPDCELNIINCYYAIFENIKQFPTSFSLNRCDAVEFKNVDFEGVENIDFKEDSTVWFIEAKNLRDFDFSKINKLKLCKCDLKNFSKLEFEKASAVDLSESYNFPEVLDFSNVDNVDLSGCDLKGVKEIKFKEGSYVDIAGAKNFPENLDLSMVKDVDFESADFSGVKQLKVKKKWRDLRRLGGFPDVIDCAGDIEYLSVNFVDAEKITKFNNCRYIDLYLSDCRNMPEENDFSEFFRVQLQHTYFSDDVPQGDNPIKERVKIKAKQLEINECYKLPKVLDLSDCDEVVFRDCYFQGDIVISKCKELIFKEGSEVSFSGCRHLPKVIDVSMCNRALFYYSNLEGVEEIRFKDFAQAKSAVEGCEGFRGKILVDGETISPMLLPYKVGLEF